MKRKSHRSRKAGQTRHKGPGCNDRFVESIVAEAAKATKVVRQAAEKEVSNPIVIPVPDAKSLKEFLKNARKEYRKHHLPEKRGPKFAELDALVWIAQLEHKLKRHPTRKEIIAGITDKDQYGSNPLSVRTAEKIAKLYRLLTPYSWYGRTGEALSKQEARWLRKNLRPNQQSSSNWWTQILNLWQKANLDSSGISKMIRDTFTLSADDLAKERQRLEALRLQRTFGTQ